MIGNELERFRKAQELDFSIALAEIRNGHKKSYPSQDSFISVIQNSYFMFNLARVMYFSMSRASYEAGNSFSNLSYMFNALLQSFAFSRISLKGMCLAMTFLQCSLPNLLGSVFQQGVTVRPDVCLPRPLPGSASHRYRLRY